MSQLRRACKETLLSFLRVREWLEVHRQLEDVARELRLGGPAPRGPRKDEGGDAFHRALLSGLLSRVGQWNPEQRTYLGARQTRFVIHPSSGLARKPPAWVMSFELVQTTQLFARLVAKVEPAWLDEVGNHLLKRSYSDPHWSEKSGRASVKEHATLFGLTVLRDRSVDYAMISPVRARLMFLEHALVRGEYRSPGAFQSENRALLAEVARLRDKARQSDMLADDEALLAFFEKRVPDSVVNGKTFEAWRDGAEKTEPRLLCLAFSDVLGGAGERSVSPEHYPDRLTFHGVELQASYRFDPAAPDDGVTVSIPLAFLPNLAGGELDWTIPAWHEQKVAALLETLPRALRRDLERDGRPLAELSRVIAARLVPCGEPMSAAVARAASAESGVDVREERLRMDAIPGYLRFTCKVVGENGSLIAQSRDIESLVREHGATAHAALVRAAPRAEWDRRGLTSWDFGDLPPFFTRSVLGADLRFYPAIVDRGTSVDLTLASTEALAGAENRKGIVRLVRLACRAQLLPFTKRIPRPFARQPGMPPSRSEIEAFQDAVLLRTVETAFGLSPGAPLPRTRAAFEELLSMGTSRLAAAFEGVARAAAAASAELDETRRALESARREPSSATAAADIRAQLDHLFPADLWTSVPTARLEQFPLYLRAARARLTRAIIDPRKDASKALPFTPVWLSFLARRATAADAATAEQLRWALEDLRVAIFAPELKSAPQLGLARLTEAVAKLG